MMNRFDKRGATIIELVVSIAIIGIIGLLTTGIIVSLMQLFIYLPKDLRARSIAYEAIEAIAEGTPQKYGIRYAVEVRDATPAQFTYTFGYPADGDKRNVKVRWDSTAGKIYRSYTAFGDPVNDPQPPEELTPYYAKGDISIGARPSSPGGIFTYYKSDGSQWIQGIDPLYSIRRVEINIDVRTGTGAFEGAESSVEMTSAAAIRQYI